MPSPIKFVFMPPQDELTRWFAARLMDSMPEYEVVSPADEDEAAREIVDADGAFGWVSAGDASDPRAKLRWLQNPDAGPFFGYYYDDLIKHPCVISNPRGIYFDHISHHIMMFVLALSRGLPWYVDAQRDGRWDKDARQSGYVSLGDATALNQRCRRDWCGGGSVVRRVWDAGDRVWSREWSGRFGVLRYIRRIRLIGCCRRRIL